MPSIIPAACLVMAGKVVGRDVTEGESGTSDSDMMMRIKS